MHFEYYSYRFAKEILQHEKYNVALEELESILQSLPVFLYPGKSRHEAGLDVVQQVTNTFFDRRLVIDFGWEYHPLATKIEDSRLTADFRKTFSDLTIQAEVQFGNMARWYSDIFKFQTAYSQGLADIGLSIVPHGEFGRRMDQNVANYERVIRELPSAELSITLPILVVGISPDSETEIIDLRACDFQDRRQITANTNIARDNRWRIVHGILSGVQLGHIGADSDTGPMPESLG